MIKNKCSSSAQAFKSTLKLKIKMEVYRLVSCSQRQKLYFAGALGNENSN